MACSSTRKSIKTISYEGIGYDDASFFARLFQHTELSPHHTVAGSCRRKVELDIAGLPERYRAPALSLLWSQIAVVGLRGFS